MSTGLPEDYDWIDELFSIEYGVDSPHNVREREKEWMSGFADYVELGEYERLGDVSFDEVWSGLKSKGHDAQNYRLSDFEDAEPLNCLGRALSAEIYRERMGMEPLNVLIQYEDKGTTDEPNINKAHVSLMNETETYGYRPEEGLKTEILSSEDLLSLYLVSEIAEELSYDNPDIEVLADKKQLLDDKSRGSIYFEKKSNELDRAMDEIEYEIVRSWPANDCRDIPCCLLRK